jgi:hypothetical protein
MKFRFVFTAALVVGVGAPVFAQTNQHSDSGDYVELNDGMKPEDCGNCGTKPTKCDQATLKQFDDTEFGVLWASLSTAQLEKSASATKICMTLGGVAAAHRIYTSTWHKGDVARTSKIRQVKALHSQLSELSKFCSEPWNEAKRPQLTAAVDSAFAKLNEILKASETSLKK